MPNHRALSALRRLGVDPEAEAGPGELGPARYFLRSGALRAAVVAPVAVAVASPLGQRVSAPQHPVDGLLPAEGGRSKRAGSPRRPRPWNRAPLPSGAVAVARVRQRPSRRSI